MTDAPEGISTAFQTFLDRAPQHAAAWMGAVQGLVGASALDTKTAELAYLAVLAVLRMESGVPFHVARAKRAGASRDEIISAVLVRPAELLLRRLADALARTSRQVNTLDRRVRQLLDGQIRWIQGTLGEREREDHVRLKHLMRSRSG